MNLVYLFSLVMRCVKRLLNKGWHNLLLKRIVSQHILVNLIFEPLSQRHAGEPRRQVRKKGESALSRSKSLIKNECGIGTVGLALRVVRFWH